MLKPQHLLWLPLTLHTASMKSLSVIKKGTHDTTQHTSASLWAWYTQSVHLHKSRTGWCTYARKLLKCFCSRTHWWHAESNFWPSTYRPVCLTTGPPCRHWCECANKWRHAFSKYAIHSLTVALCAMSNEPNCSGLKEESIKPPVSDVIKASTKHSAFVLWKQDYTASVFSSTKIKYWWKYFFLLFFIFCQFPFFVLYFFLFCLYIVALLRFWTLDFRVRVRDANCQIYLLTNVLVETWH